MKGHRLQGQYRFTCLVHWFNGFLEPLRRNDCAEVTTCIDDYANTSSNGNAVNSGDESVSLSSYPAHANCVGLTNDTSVVDVDIIVAGREKRSSEISQGDIIAPFRVSTQGVETERGVAAAVVFT